MSITKTVSTSTATNVLSESTCYFFLAMNLIFFLFHTFNYK